jgi:hypothetical protein
VGNPHRGARHHRRPTGPKAVVRSVRETFAPPGAESPPAVSTW